MTGQKPDELLDAYLRGASTVSRAYREGAQDQPPHALDAAIIEAAQHGTRVRRRFWQPLPARWLVPLSTAAVVLLSVTLVWTLQHRELAPVPAQVVAPEPEAGIVAPGAQQKTERPMTSVGTAAKTPPAAAAADQAESPTLAGQEATPTPSADPVRAQALAKKETAPPAEMERATAPRPAASAGGLRYESRSRAVQAMTAAPLAQVISVAVTGTPGAYQFAVGIRSADTGCNQYADWWEVVSEDGKLLYRRILDHSHADEQPFVRAGGPVAIQPGQIVIVRVHMHPGGYAETAFKGAAKGGFAATRLAPGFAPELAQQPPLPKGCAF